MFKNKKIKKSTIIKGIVVGALGAGALYALYKLKVRGDHFKYLYNVECECYVDLARTCGVHKSGDHTSIAKTIFKDGSEYIYLRNNSHKKHTL